MFDDKTFSRGEFLAIIGGIAVTAMLAKVSGARKVLAAVKPEKKTALAPELSAYGNHAYGGKRG